MDVTALNDASIHRLSPVVDLEPEDPWLPVSPKQALRTRLRKGMYQSLVQRNRHSIAHPSGENLFIRQTHPQERFLEGRTPLYWAIINKPRQTEEESEGLLR